MVIFHSYVNVYQRVLGSNGIYWDLLGSNGIYWEIQGNSLMGISNDFSAGEEWTVHEYTWWRTTHETWGDEGVK